MKKLAHKKDTYTITVTSWENDADYYNTVSIDIANKQEVLALSKMLQLLFSYGSEMQCPTEKAKNSFDKELVRIHEDFETVFAYEEPVCIEDVIYGMYEIYYDLGLSGGESYHLRVIDDIKIYYHQEDVYEDDVTNEFIKQ